MNTNTETTVALEPELFSEKMQTAFSQKNEPDPPAKSKFKYMETAFVKKVAEFLQPNSEIKRITVAQTGDPNFYAYSEALTRIRDLIGPPSGVKPVISENQKSEVLDIVNSSNARKPLVFLIQELWNLNLTDHRSTRINDSPELSSNKEATINPCSEKPENHNEGQDYKALLLSFVKIKTPLSSEQLNVLISSISARTAEAEIQSRQYLESMLYIGAGIIFFRFQCALLEEDKAEILRKELLSALNKHFKKSTLSALDSIVGRVRRAYIKSMAFHLDIAEPKISDKEALWSLYKDSISEIPKLVDRYYEGDLRKAYLKGIPYIPTVGKAKDKEAPPKEKPDWAEHIKKLRAMFEAAEPKAGSPKPEFDSGFLDSTMFSLETLTELLEKQDTTTLTGYRDSIENQIKRLQSLLMEQSKIAKK